MKATSQRVHPKGVQPIENAPRDGSLIIGIYDDGDEIVAEWVEPAWFQIGPDKWVQFGPGSGYWVQSSIAERIDEPPFWRPLEYNDLEGSK